MYDVVGLGELLIDFTPAGKSEFGMDLFEQNPGGAPANMLAVIKKVGLNAAFIGKVGNDMHGIFLKNTLDYAGIDTKWLVMDEDVFTTLAFVKLSDDGERTFSFARKPGADTMLRFDELEQDALTCAKVFHVGSLSLTNEPARTTTIKAVKAAKGSGAIISYDPNYRNSLWESEEKAMEQMKSMISYADIMKISEEETALLTPYNDPQKAASYLINQGVKLVAVTLGEKGAYVENREGSVLVPGYKSQVVDTTGAGDSFWGGFVSQLILSGKKPEDLTIDEMMQSGRFGNAVASLAVERRGGIPSVPSLEKVKERLEVNVG